MIGFLIFLLFVGGIAFAVWLYGPQVMDAIKLKRANERVINLTKQTKRDMDNLSRKQRGKDGW